MENISKHITYAEATISQTAIRNKINNTPTPEALQNMKLVAEKIFEPVRNHFRVPIRISSFYRCEALNKAVGGSKTSQHRTGEAIDLQATRTITNKEIFDWIKANLVFDQLIWEFGDKNNPAWVHISYSKTKNRNQILYIK